MKLRNAAKKYFVFALTVVLMASLLTVPAFAAGIMDGLQELRDNVLDAAAILCVIAAVVLGIMTYAKTHSKPGTIGVILFFALLAGIAGAPDLITGWGDEMAGWF